MDTIVGITRGRAGRIRSGKPLTSVSGIRTRRYLLKRPSPTSAPATGRFSSLAIELVVKFSDAMVEKTGLIHLPLIGAPSTPRGFSPHQPLYGKTRVESLKLAPRVPAKSLVLQQTRLPRTLHVESVGADSFTAIHSESGVRDRRFRFPRELVAQGDQKLLRPGAAFYWSIGFQLDETGQPQQVQELRFRRSVRVPVSIQKEAAARADETIRGRGVTPITDEDLDKHDEDLGPDEGEEKR